MIDLKNIRQIGSPAQWDKIYVEEDAYEILTEETSQHEIFVLMGRTKNDGEKYESFIEAVIPVHSITFSKNVPIWNSHAWNDVFDDIKQYYSDSVIVGWAVRDQGIPLKMAKDLEGVHQEQFSGAHQVLMMIDTREKEEAFYKMHGGHLVQETGYYIYYDTEKKQHKYPVVNIEEVYETRPRGKYREMMQQTSEIHDRHTQKTMEKVMEKSMEKSMEKPMDGGRWLSIVAVAVVAILLVAIVRTEMRRNEIGVSDIGKTVQTWSQNVQNYVLDNNFATEENDMQQQVEKTESE